MVIHRKNLEYYINRALKEDIKAPADWQGNLNVTYYLGPVLKDPQWKIKMVVHTSNKVATIYNTIGILEGKEEPGSIFNSLILKLTLLNI